LAELRQAEIDLASTTVSAPSDAIAANVKLQPGEYVEEGDAVMSLVSTGGFWIEANVKETDLTHLAVGHEAELVVDAYPGVTWKGRVASLAPATGAEYALLPPQNASGNWVKVVQRVPVRVEIVAEEGAPELRAGMSVAVSIDTGFERPLPGLVATARAWILPPEQ
jgi:membrane fusion protein (multidrug efflux system)